MNDSPSASYVAVVAMAVAILAGPLGASAGGAVVTASTADGAGHDEGPASEPVVETVENWTDTLDNSTGNTTDTDGNTTGETLDTATNTTEDTTEAGTDLTENTTGSVEDTSENTTETIERTTDSTTESVEETTENTTESVKDATENSTETVENATANATRTIENTTTDATRTIENTTTDATGTIENTTANATGTIENTTANATGTVANPMENVTSSVTNTTENVTSAFANGSADLVQGATDLTRAVSVEGNTTAGVGVTESIGSKSRPADSISTASSADAADRSDGASERTTAADSTDAPSRPTESGAMAAPSERAGESPGSSPDSSGSGAALGGALVVAGVTAAGASKQIAAATPAAQGRELTWFGRALRARVGATTETARSKLARLPRLVFPPGYSRHDDSDPLEHDVRRSLFETVERSPGANLTSLADGADVSMSTVRHHLRILEAENLLVGERIRGQRRYFLSNESEPALVAALDDAATEPILRALARSGPASVSDLAERLGRDPSTITHHLSRLEDDGLVERERDGRSVQNQLAPVAERVLDRSAASRRRRPVATD